jgi:glycosyltransferase involved in cell wall biosynthesis
MRRPHKIVFVAQHPIHYHAVIYRRAAADPQLAAEVYFMQGAWASGGFEPEFGKAIDWGVPLTAGYRSTQFTNVSPMRDGQGFFKFVNPGLIWKIFRSDHATVYVHGMNYFTHVGCMLAARLSGKQLILRTITYDLAPPSGLKGLLRRCIYRILFKLPTKFLYIGTHNANFFRAHGVPDKKLVYAPHVVDNSFFQSQREALRGQEASIKQSLGIAPEKRVIAFVGKFTSGKRVSFLAKAFRAASLENWTLVAVGDGEENERLRSLAREAGPQVVISGFLDQKAICRIYAIADILVLPSVSETWGLVVNEALNFGTAIIASDKVGCTVDLVADRTGIVFPWRDFEALTNAIRRVADDEEYLEQMQQSGLRLIAGWDVGRYVNGLKKAIGLGAPETDDNLVPTMAPIQGERR